MMSNERDHGLGEDKIKTFVFRVVGAIIWLGFMLSILQAVWLAL